MARDNREPLQPGTSLQLMGAGGTTAAFRVGAVIRYEEEALLYQAVRAAADGGVTGTLKELYPQDPAVFRRPDDSLYLPEAMRAEKTLQMQQAVSLLHRLKENVEELRGFLPYTESFVSAQGGLYLFCPERAAAVTLEQYAAQSAAEPTQQKLVQILSVLYAFSCAVSRLNAAGAELKNLCPRNILLVRRSSPNGSQPEYLRDAAALADAENVLYPIQYNADGKPISDDAREIGTVLYTVLTGGKALPQTQAELTAALQQGPFGAVMQAETAAQLARVLHNASEIGPDAAVHFAEELVQIIQKMETETAGNLLDRLHAMENRLEDNLCYLMYRWPFHTYGRPGARDISVLIAGDDAPAMQKTLREVFSACHVLGCQLHVTLAAQQARQIAAEFLQSIDHAETWIDFRGTEPPCAYNWADKVMQLCCRETSPEAAAAQPGPDVGVVLLLNSRGEGLRLAQLVPQPEDGRRLCAYTAVSGKTLYAGWQERLDLVALTPETVDDAFHAMADRIGFNAHFLYEREKNSWASCAEINRSYAESYNYQASLRTAMAVKCRLWSAGIPWSEDTRHMAQAYETALAQDSTLLRQLSWLEHRRWLCSKLAGGAALLPAESYPELLDGGNGSGTNLYSGGRLLHAYLVESRLQEQRPQGWQTLKDWKQQHGEIPPELDPLSRAGVRLLWMFRQDAAQVDIKTTKTLLQEELTALQKNASAPELAQDTAWYLCTVDRLLADTAGKDAAGVYKTARNVLQQGIVRLEQQGIRHADNVRMLMQMLDNKLFSRLQLLVMADPKTLDDTMVQNLGFMLQNRKLTLGKILSREDLLANLAPAKSFVPERLVYAAYAPKQKTAAQYLRIFANLNHALQVCGIGCPVELRLFAAADCDIPEQECVRVVPVENRDQLTEAFAAQMADCDVIDITNGQEALCTLVTGPAMLQENGRFSAVHGTLPAAAPQAQPFGSDELFELSGAVPVSAGAPGVRENDHALYAAYQNILTKFGPKAWHDSCDAFARAYNAVAKKYFTLSPYDQLDRLTQEMLSTDQLHHLEPVLRDMEQYGFIRDFSIAPTKTPDIMQIRYYTTATCQTLLSKMVGSVKNSRFRIEQYGITGQESYYQIEGIPLKLTLRDTFDPAVQQVFQYLADRGFIQLDCSWGEMALADPDPRLVTMLQKYGTAMETETYMKLMESGAFSTLKMNYTYRWSQEPGSPVNEIDVVGVTQNRLVLVSVKACAELQPAFVNEIYTLAHRMNVQALPVMVCSELKHGEQEPFRSRCEASDVLLIDRDGLADMAQTIIQEAARRSAEGE